MSSANQIINKDSSTACVSREGAILQLLTRRMPVNLHFSAGSSKGGKKWGNPLERTKPTEIFSLMKVGLTVVAKRMASKLCLMSEAWVSTELLYNSTPIGSERKRQLNPVLGGGGLVRDGQHGEMRIQERKHAWEKDLQRKCGEVML